MIKVYHSTKSCRAFTLTNKEAAEKWQRGEYELVAEIDTDDLEMAWFHTNHITKRWWEDTKVTLIKVSRSTMVGDVFERNGEFHHVCSVGFSKIEPELLQTAEVSHV